MICEAGVPSSFVLELGQEYPATEVVLLQLCGLPAVARHRYTCQHGHAVDKSTCERHAPVDDAVGCRACLLEQGHDCPMVFEPIPVLDAKLHMA